MSRTRNETSEYEWSAQFLQSSQQENSKARMYEIWSACVMNSLNQSFEIDYKEKQSAERRLWWVLPKP